MLVIPPRSPFAILLVASALSSLGCSGNIKTALGPNNSHIISCGHGMSSCVNKANKICGEDGYTILEGVSRSKLLGGSSSSYREISEVAELTVRCGIVDEDEEQPEVVYKLPERTDEPLVEPEPIAPTAAPSSSGCTPGSTLACVGAGACQGGQVCLDTGRGYGPCDCGDEATKVEPDTTQKAPKEGLPEVPGAVPEPTPLSE